MLLIQCIWIPILLELMAFDIQEKYEEWALNGGSAKLDVTITYLSIPWYIRRQLRSCCAKIKDEKSDLWLLLDLIECIKQIKTQRLLLTCAHLFLSYHLIYFRWCILASNGLFNYPYIWWERGGGWICQTFLS